MRQKNENSGDAEMATTRPEASSAGDLSAIVGKFRASASDGDWGSYSITVQIETDGSGKVYESNVDFRDSPQVSTERCGTFTKSGNVVTFTSSSVKQKTSGAGGESEETKESAISIRFLIQGPEGAPDKLARLEGTSDEVAKMSGGMCGDPEPAILTKAR
eukprot:s1184_g30.t1